MSAAPPFPFPFDGLCRHWLPGRTLCGRPLSGEGFSGSPVWRVDALDAAGVVDRSTVLKGFPEGWPRGRAEAIHRFAAALADAGIEAIPRNLPVAPPGVGSIVEEPSGRLWECSEFRPGMPAVAPTPEQARQALVTLAGIHLVAARRGADGLFPPHIPAETGPSGVPAWERRRRRLERVVGHGWRRSRSVGRSPLARSIDERRAVAAGRLARAGCRSVVARLAALSAGGLPAFAAPPLQPVLRDIWNAHVLFDGPRVSAVIDLHAAGIDTPATDLARLLGSWRSGDGPGAVGAGRPVASGPPARLTEIWRGPLDAYRGIRPLTRTDLFLVDLLHVGGVIGGLDHWFEWVLDDGKAFVPPPQVEARVDFLLENLDSALTAADSLLGEAG